MAKNNEITVDVKMNLTVDRKTAEACLKLVVLYLNTSGSFIIKEFDNDGELNYRLSEEG